MTTSGSPQVYRIFISRVTGELGKASEELAGDLRKKGLLGKIQIDFRQEEDTATTLDKLEKYVRESHAVIALVGVQSGSYPPDAAAKKWEKLLPTGITRATYTQWEIHFARAYGKRLSFYFAFSESDGSILYPAEKVPNAATDDPARQKAHVLWLTGTLGLDRQYFSTIDQLCRQVLTEAWPEFPRRRPNNLPFDTLGDLFVGREEFLKEIHRGLTEARAAKRHDPNHVIWGLGGIGKTRTAHEYAWAHENDYTALLFVSGETPDQLTANIAGLTGVLGIPAQDGTPTNERYAATLGWLQEHPGWLLIIDNVDDAPAVVAVQEKLTALSAGHVIITARLGGWTKGVISLELHLLSTPAAVRYLLATTDQQRKPAATPEQDTKDAAALAHAVDHLSLALETAAAYIAQQHISFAEYTAALAAQPAALLDFLDAATTDYKKNITGAERTVARTWLITLSRLSAPARELLRVLSWFAPDPIPASVLAYDPAKDAPCDPAPTKAILQELERYAFIHWDNSFRSFNLHRLVQEITRQQQTTPLTPPALVTALKWVNALFIGEPYDVRSWPVLNPLLSHAQTVATFAADRAIAEPTSRLLSQVGILLDTKAQYQAAEPFYRRALGINEANYGPEHSEVAIVLNNLAQLLQATNRLAEAEPLMRRALAIDEANFGPEHRKVAIRLNNLAMLLQATNRLAEAEPLMRRALAIDEANFGPQHPEVATDLNNLATLLQATNRLAEAEPLRRHALAIDEANFGPDHPKVATRLNNLAQLLEATNRLPEAEPLMRRALVIDETNFGPNHPRVALELSNLALLLKTTNRLAEAEPLMRRALTIDEASFGPNHPKVAIRLNNLVTLLHATNRLTEAEPLMRRALAIDEASFGPSHPRVANGLSNLATLLHATNRLAEAEPLMRRALAIDEASFGPNHSKVANRLNNLATLLQDTNRLAEAEPLIRRALAIDEANFGPDHPCVAYHLNNLAQLLKATNRLAEAEPLLRHTLEILVNFTRDTGHPHPHLEHAIDNYKILLTDMGLSPAQAQTKIDQILNAPA